MINGLLRKRGAMAQPIAITVEEGQALSASNDGATHHSTLYALAVVLRVSFFLALVAKSLTLWHW